MKKLQERDPWDDPDQDDSTRYKTSRREEGISRKLKTKDYGRI
jgi:hypothetical protein